MDWYSGFVYGIWLAFVASLIFAVGLYIYRKFIYNHVFEVPVIDVNKDMLLAEIQVGNKKGYLVIDTGSNVNVITSEFLEGVDSIFIKQNKKETLSKAYTASSYHELYPCLLDAIISKTPFSSVPFSIMEGFTDINVTENLGLEYPVVGILGYNFMKEYNWQIDTKHNKVYRHV